MSGIHPRRRKAELLPTTVLSFTLRINLLLYEINKTARKADEWFFFSSTVTAEATINIVPLSYLLPRRSSSVWAAADLLTLSVWPPPAGPSFSDHHFRLFNHADQRNYHYQPLKNKKFGHFAAVTFRMARHDFSQWLIILTRRPQVDGSVNYNQSKWRTVYEYYCGALKNNKNNNSLTTLILFYSHLCKKYNRGWLISMYNQQRWVNIGYLIKKRAGAGLHA